MRMRISHSEIRQNKIFKTLKYVNSKINEKNNYYLVFSFYNFCKTIIEVAEQMLPETNTRVNYTKQCIC